MMQVTEADVCMLKQKESHVAATNTHLCFQGGGGAAKMDWNHNITLDPELDCVCGLRLVVPL